MNTPNELNNLILFLHQMIDTNTFVSIVRPNIKNSNIYSLRVEGNWDSWSLDSIVNPNITQYWPVESISFKNKNKGWLAGFRKINDIAVQLIMQTEDGGKNWQVQRDTNMNTYMIFSLDMYDENFGMVTGSDNCVLMTTDGGKNWVSTKINTPYGNILVSVQVTSKTSSYVIGNRARIYKYKAGGWSDVREPVEGKGVQISPQPCNRFH